MIRRPTIFTLSSTLFPYTTPVRSARVAHVFDVQQDRAGVAVDGEMVEQVGEVDVERVADRNHRREPDVARARPLQHARRNRAGLRQQRKVPRLWPVRGERSEEHTSELQSLMRISYAVLYLKKKKNT